MQFISIFVPPLENPWKCPSSNPGGNLKLTEYKIYLCIYIGTNSNLRPQWFFQKFTHVPRPKRVHPMSNWVHPSPERVIPRHERACLRPEKPHPKPEKAHYRPERTHPRPDRAHPRPERALLRSEAQVSFQSVVRHLTRRTG